MCKEYAEVASKCVPKFYAQLKFESDHPEYGDLMRVYENRGLLDRETGKEKKEKFSIDSFNYMF